MRDYRLAPEQAEQLLAVERWTLQGFGEQLPLLTRRVTAGLVIDGHGDAHRAISPSLTARCGRSIASNSTRPCGSWTALAKSPS
ncbi:MAG: hypothetical protein MZW92_34405 [Comamonadaceae bacterium]|nr:hypothetical protein [Comamonadaceae bacterium]